MYDREVRSGNSRRKARNKGGTTTRRPFLTLLGTLLMNFRARVSHHHSDRIRWWIEFHYEMNRRQVRRCVISLQTILEHYGRYVDEFVHLFLELTGSANPKVRWSARRALRSRGDTGRLERRLVSRRAREAEKRDGQVRFSVRPCLPELGMGLPSFHSRPPSLFVEYPGPNA